MIYHYNRSTRKNNVKKYSIYFLLVIVIGLFQIIFLKFFGIEGIMPDLLLLLCIWFTLSEGQFYGLLFAFIAGVYFDIISFDVIGTNALAKITAALLAGWFYGENKIKRNLGSYRFIIIVFIASFFHNIIYYFIHIDFSEISFIPFFFRYGIAISIYTSVVAMIPMLLQFRRNKFIVR